MAPSKNEVESNHNNSLPTFTSKLGVGPQRFLAHVIEHGLEVERRTAEDFVRHFPPSDIMDGLSTRAALRAAILEPTTGLKRKIGIKKSSQSAGEDLQIALDEGETDSEQIVGVFQPDDRVRYLDNVKLWAYVIEGEFWMKARDGSRDYERAKEHVAFILDRALTDGLLTHADLVDGVSVEKLAQSLPREQLAALINAALELGRSKKVFTEEALLETAAAQILVEDVSLVHIWETVVVPKIAIAHGLSEPAEECEPILAEEWDEPDGQDESDAPVRASPPTAAPKVVVKEGAVAPQSLNPVETPKASESRATELSTKTRPSSKLARKRDTEAGTEARNLSSTSKATKAASLSKDVDEACFTEVIHEVIEEIRGDELEDDAGMKGKNIRTH